MHWGEIGRVRDEVQLPARIAATRYMKKLICWPFYWRVLTAPPGHVRWLTR